MKKILFLLTITLCFACSSDDDGNRITRFHPPSWIQGTWYVQGASQTTGVKFTSDDFCEITGSHEQCFKILMDNSEDDQVFVEDEHSSDDYYEFEIVYLGEPGVERDEEYRYEKKSDTQMVSVNDDGVEIYTYNKQ